MRFFHLSDLHLGRRLYEYSLIDDQRHILSQITELARSYRPDAVLIAGDIYDKPIPTVEAVRLLDEFLSGLSALGIKVLAIAGNHDSPERVGFGGGLMQSAGVYLAHEFDGMVECVTLSDTHGEVDFYLLPFIKPSAVKRFFPDADFSDTDTNATNAALKCVLDSIEVDPKRRSVLISHQFVSGAIRSDSEEISVGGADNVDLVLYESFDYTALGHIHRPQRLGERIRYSGSPLKYSFSEAAYKKHVPLVELGADGELTVTELELKPLRELCELRGSYEELTRRDFWGDTTLDEDYVHITLTDEDDIPEAAAKLRVIYRNLMKLDYDNTRTRTGGTLELAASEVKSPLELFADFYKQQNGRDMDERQLEFMRELTERIFEP